MPPSPSDVKYAVEPESLGLRQPVAIVSFGGWMDAGSAGTGAVRFLMGAMNAQRLARIEPDQFFSYTDTRPISRVVAPGERRLRWPRGDFRFARLAEDASSDLLTFVSPEPNLRWRTYARTMLDVMQRANVRGMVCVGALLGMIHHRGPVPLNGWASTLELRTKLEQLDIGFTAYEGPSGFVTALMSEAQDRGLPAATVLGFSPSYIQGVPNPRVSHALLTAANKVMDLSLDLSDLERQGRILQRQVDRLLTDQPELREQVDRMLTMSQQAEPEPTPDESDEALPPGGSVELPSPQAVVAELEEFLRQLREKGGDTQETPPGTP